ncbi:hypothetical protein [Endozoicomonas sp. Mp262]|uniref:hypothetical protein n=1 Tax=Endozoicomonas sp. Mp262 TaxID=2919499 RepID=UPI0021DB6D0D
MFKRFITLLLIAMLTGCAGTNYNSAQALQTGGIIQINELPKSVAEKEGYDLKVVIRSVYDVGLNTNKLEARLKLISILTPDCHSPALISEKVIEGKTAIGVTMNRYYMDVQCSPGMS